MRTENTDQLRLGHWLIEADRRCGQMSVEYDMDRLAAIAIKLHSIHTCACTFTHCRVAIMCVPLALVTFPCLETPTT